MKKILKYIGASLKEAFMFSSLRGFVTLCSLLLLSGVFAYFNNIVTDIAALSIFGLLALGILWLFGLGIRNMFKE